MTMSSYATSFWKRSENQCAQNVRCNEKATQCQAKKGRDQSIDHVNLSVPSLAIAEATASTSKTPPGSVSLRFFSVFDCHGAVI
jgi:hypothetical protein